MENNVISEFFSRLFLAIIGLGLLGGIVYLCWNYGFSEVVNVGKMKYFHAILIIIGWRSLNWDYLK